MRTHVRMSTSSPPAGPSARHILLRVCGRYTNTAGPEELNDRFRAPIPSPDGTRRFNIAPTEEVLAIVAPKGQPQARMLRSAEHTSELQPLRHLACRLR